MSLAPITFNVQRADQKKESVQAYQKQVTNFEDLLTPDQKLKILERDDYSCRFCGFRAEKYQKIHFKNGNPHDHAEENLMSACIYCHQCFHMDAVAAMKSGVLVWMPEIRQPVLNNIMRSIYVARISQGEMSDIAKKLLDTLMGRREDAKRRIGTDDPMILSSVLKDYLEAHHYAKRMDKLEGIRLLPLDRRIIKEGDLEFNQFPQILAYWRSKDGPYGGVMPKKWLEEYKEMVQGTGNSGGPADGSQAAA